MMDLINAVTHYGWAPVLVGVGIFLLVKGEFNFRYPRK